MNKHSTDQLQFLRFAAMFTVFSFHCMIRGMEGWPLDYGRMWIVGTSGLVFFFILSGVLSGYYACGRDETVSLRDIPKYMWSKVRKFYPLYFTVTLFSVCYWDIPRMVADGAWGEFKYYFWLLVRHLLLIQSWGRVFPSDYYMYSEVGWFLSSIMFLYLINIPLRIAASYIRKSKKANVIFAVIMVVTVLLTNLYCYMCRNTDTEFWANVFPVSRTGEYVSGMALGYMLYPAAERIRDGKGAKRIFTVLEAASLIIWYLWTKLPIEAGTSWEFRISRWLIPNLLVLAVFTLGRGYVSDIFRIGILRFLGDISFEFYLIHSMVIKQFTNNTGSGTLTGAYTSRLGWYTSIAFCMLLSILFSWMVSGRKIPRRKSRPDSADAGVNG